MPSLLAQVPAVTAWLLVLAWLVPTHYPPWVTAHSEIVAGVAAALFALFAVFAGLGRPRGPGSTAPRKGWPWPAVVLALLALVPLLQWAAGQIRYAGDAWIAAMYLAGTALVVWAGERIAERDVRDWSRAFASAVLAGALLSALVALWQRFDVDLGELGLFVVDVRPGYPPGGNLAQPNQLATLLGLGLASLLLLFEQRRLGAWPAVAAAALLAATMAMTQSRTPLLLFVAGAFALAVLRRRLDLRVRPAVVVLLVAVWALAFLAWPAVADALHLSQMRASLGSRTQAGPRTVMWTQMAEAVTLSPWVGYGWNQVSLGQMAVLADYPDSRLLEYSHNLLLDLAIWQGVPLALLVAGLASWWLWRALRRVQTPAGGFGLLVILLLLAHSMVELPHAYLYYLVPFGLAVGLVEADAGFEPAVTVPQPLTALAVLAMTALMSVAALDYLRVEHEYREMRLTVARIGRPMVEHPPPLLDTMFTQLAVLHRAWLTTPRPGMDRQEAFALAAVAERYGYAPLLYRAALALAYQGDIPGARRMLQRLANVHLPLYHEAALREIRMLVDQGQPQLRPLLPGG